VIPEFRRFQLMPQLEQVAALRRLAALGWVVRDISRVTGLEADHIRRTLGDHLRSAST
jgi:hypothetical protein